MTVSRLIGYCGAGIYEELLFRLIMLPIAAAVFRAWGCNGRSSWGWGILASSLFFSAAHYHVFAAGGYAFDWYTFTFRFAAGLFFAGAVRGPRFRHRGGCPRHVRHSRRDHLTPAQRCSTAVSLIACGATFVKPRWHIAVNRLPNWLCCRFAICL